MLNIVVPMAGRGSRFSKAGYALPKPLLPVHGTPMISFVIGNLRPRAEHRFIFLCQREHLDAYALEKTLTAVSPGAVVIPLDGITEGAACTVLLSRHLIDNDDPLMIANCDQYVAIGMDDYLASGEGLDGLIMTMTACDPKWSFVRMNGERVTEVVEKKAVSDEATVGIYNFHRGADFVAAAGAMIAADDRVNGEFYVAPVYNYLIRSGYRVGIRNIGRERAGMYGLGIPEDLEYFNALPELPRG